MNLLPFQQRTYVLPYGAAEVFDRLEAIILDPDAEVPKAERQRYLFNGVLREDGFNISKRIGYVQNFLPLIKGRVEDTKKGSILFVKFRMFKTVLFMLGFWSLFLVIIGLVFIFQKGQVVYGSWAIAIFIGQYLICMINFNKQLKDSQKLLEEVLKF